MKIDYTNKNGLPEFVVDWLKVDEYDHNNDPRHISATGLKQPPRAILLARDAELVTVDISNRLASRIGTAIHDSIERAAVGDRREERHSAILGDWTISGKFDMIYQNQLVDVKTTSVYKYIKQDYRDYIDQLSVYRWILAQNGETVAENALIWFIFTDWSSAAAKRDRSYPQSKTLVVKIDLMTIDETEDYIFYKLKRIEDAEKQLGETGDLVECTAEERWQTPDVYAIKRQGVQRARKLCNNLEEAQTELKEGEHIELRKGVPRRCEYCDVSSVCGQYKELTR